MKQNGEKVPEKRMHAGSLLMVRAPSRRSGCRTRLPCVIGHNQLCSKRCEKSQRAQKVEYVLLGGCRTLLEFRHHGVCFGTVARVSLDSVEQIPGTSVVQEKDTLAQSPQRGRPKFLRAGGALNDVIGQPSSHVMQQ